MFVSTIRCLGALAFAAACVAAIAEDHPAAAASAASAAAPAKRPGIAQYRSTVGHDDLVLDEGFRRFQGIVTALPAPDAQGHIYSVEASPLGGGPAGEKMVAPAPGDLRHWRMSMLTGKRFSKFFTISDNTANKFTVTSSHGPLDGIAVKDVFVIDSVDDNGVSLYAPAPGAASAPPGGLF